MNFEARSIQPGQWGLNSAWLSKKSWLWLGLLLLILLALLAGCRRSGQDLADVRVDLVINPNPPQVGEATLTLTLSDSAGQSISGAEVEFEGNMSHAGMAPTLTQAPEVAPGRYEAPLQFNMAGDWFILVRAALPDGRQLERQVDVPGVEGQ
ncbi:MAG TPA: FixH family protein [Anaerolineae bacterium]|nr:FixH family protein [Anaerolineae bacterium]